MIDPDDINEDLEDYVLSEQRLAAFKASGDSAIPLAELVADLELSD